MNSCEHTYHGYSVKEVGGQEVKYCVKCSEKGLYYADASEEDQKCVATCPRKMYVTMNDGVGKRCVSECAAPNVLQKLDTDHDILCMTVAEASQYIAEHSAVVVRGAPDYFLECDYYSADPQGGDKHESGAFVAPEGTECRVSCIAQG